MIHSIRAKLRLIVGLSIAVAVGLVVATSLQFRDDREFLDRIAEVDSIALAYTEFVILARDLIHEGTHPGWKEAVARVRETVDELARSTVGDDYDLEGIRRSVDEVEDLLAEIARRRQAGAREGDPALGTLSRELFQTILGGTREIHDLYGAKYREMNRQRWLSGLAATAAIRGDASCGDPFIAMFSASVQPSDRIACLDAGADAFLPKPVRVGELRRLLQERGAGPRGGKLGH